MRQQRQQHPSCSPIFVSSDSPAEGPPVFTSLTTSFPPAKAMATSVHKEGSLTRLKDLDAGGVPGMATDRASAGSCPALAGDASFDLAMAVSGGGGDRLLELLAAEVTEAGRGSGSMMQVDGARASDVGGLVEELASAVSAGAPAEVTGSLGDAPGVVPPPLAAPGAQEADSSLEEAAAAAVSRAAEVPLQPLGHGADACKVRSFCLLA